jgi:DNA-binding NarL/FixJ family response regulator
VSHRVLVVDDYEPWRQHIREVLDAAAWQIIGEASDGPEAIARAQALKPDLILLDVGLPSMSGIKVAERILSADPRTRILFVSEHRSLAEAALAIGARGYIIKSNAATELLPAMTSVVEGRRYVGLDAAPPPFQAIPEDSVRHDVGFFNSEAELLDTWVDAAQTALAAGHSVIVLAVEARISAMIQQLRDRGALLDRTIDEGRYRSLEVHEMLSQFMVDDAPDEQLFEKAVAPIVADALKASIASHPRVMVCGEAAPTLWRLGKRDASLRLEQLWDELAAAHEIDTVCGYIIQDAIHDDRLRQIRSLHTVIFPT